MPGYSLICRGIFPNISIHSVMLRPSTVFPPSYVSVSGGSCVPPLLRSLYHFLFLRTISLRRCFHFTAAGSFFTQKKQSIRPYSRSSAMKYFQMFSAGSSNPLPISYAHISVRSGSPRSSRADGGYVHPLCGHPPDSAPHSPTQGSGGSRGCIPFLD